MKTIQNFSKRLCISNLILLLVLSPLYGQNNLTINDQGYFEMQGVTIMVFDDYYPSGHQSGITIIQNGVRVAANGDLRLSRYAEKGEKNIDKKVGIIQQQLKYENVPLTYNVKVKAEGTKAIVTLNLDKPIPEEWVGRAWFRLELFPTILFGKSWNMDGQVGTFPTDSYGPLLNGDIKPYSEGKLLTVAPETESQRLTIKALKGNLQLTDGRRSSKGGWFIIRTAVPAGVTDEVIKWEVEAFPEKNYIYKPVIHLSQVGYKTSEPKKAVIELDKTVSNVGTVEVIKVNPNGTKSTVFSNQATLWGKYLRYQYAVCDFSSISEPGIYQVKYGDIKSNHFKIGQDIYERYVWQPILEYFLPVQMCHMRIEQGSRVWHDWCHLDDALMAPTNHEHFDGYSQGPETFVDYKHPQHVPFIDRGGWHDAGDYDLRVESQANTTLRLAQMYELFGKDLDVTTVDQEKRLVTIHRTDGVSDYLQQVEHGVLTVLGGYRGLGRLYDGIICRTRKQYGLKGDGGAMTDDLVYDPEMPEDGRTAYHSGLYDDRWVFTEDHARHEMIGIASLAAAARVLKDYQPEIAEESLAAAEALFEITSKKEMVADQVSASAELYLTTMDKKYLNAIVAQKEFILSNMPGTAWAVGRIYKHITDADFRKDMDKAVVKYAKQLEKEMAENPFGIPYKPNIWGAGWIIQNLGVRHYFLVTGFPEVFKPDLIYNAMQFVLGCHPGMNTASFASGVGEKSLLQAYGVNRADLSYIPGGVASGTALIRPDYPELKDNWSFLWQQTEYVLGGGATNFMFLVLATDQLLKQ
ncbi:glycoside hydrolase family 9 protein [Bacteroidota bacterium]